MLNNLTNFFNLIRGRKIKTTLANSDLIAIGVRDSRFDGSYQPAAIKYEDFAAQQTVAVDGITITGDGTLGDPLIATIPDAPYRVLTAYISQTGTSAPVISGTIYQNTLTTPFTFEYVSPGSYKMSSPEFLTGSVACIFLSSTAGSQSAVTLSTNLSLPGTDYILLYTSNSTGTPANDLMPSSFIEIRIY
jgi:hypothetical protein